jgi:hypothetical protein
MERVAEVVDPAAVAIWFWAARGVMPEDGVNVPVTPVGPAKERVTGEAKLACEPRSMVTVPVEPCATVKPVEERPNVKSPE